MFRCAIERKKRQDECDEMYQFTDVCLLFVVDEIRVWPYWSRKQSVC